MMPLSKCLKFTANIYDKSRCKNCYKPKELHSEKALECNKASRKISKCGYLFVAPETFDFNNPLDKTRRWQRRFFVLYDDGELTYSVDENINTVPQGVIDMNVCIDVYDAENATSHPHAIAIATPDNITYVKGGAKEETNRWHDVLVMYPRSTKTKHKRSPTFPQAMKPPSLDQSLPLPPSASPSPHRDLGAVSVTTDAMTTRLPRRYTIDTGVTMDTPGEAGLRGASVREGARSDGNPSDTSNPACPPSTPTPLTYRGVRSLKHHRSEHQGALRKSSSLHDLSPVAPGNHSAPGNHDPPDGQSQPCTSTPRPAAEGSPRGHGRPGVNTRSYRGHSPTTSLVLNGTSKNLTDERKMARSDFSGSSLVSDDTLSMDSSSPSRGSLSATDDSLPPGPSPHQDLEYMKKGWLVKQGTLEKDWRKLWFVLSGSELKFYEDMEGERLGAVEGSINLALCYDLQEVNVSRKYGFKLKTRHGDHTLSALTLGIRKNWMSAISACLQTVGVPRSNHSNGSLSSREGSPHNPRRAERYHTHSGAFRGAERGPERPEGEDGARGEGARRPEPPQYVVRRVGAEEVAVTTPAGKTETVRMRSRRRTTDSVTRPPDTKPGRQSSCTWPYNNGEGRTPPISRVSSTASQESDTSSSTRPLSRDLSAYLDGEDPRPLSQAEEAELDHIQRNIRKIHRRSLTDGVNIGRPRHFDKFETGSAFSGTSSPERHPSLERLNRSRESSSSPSRLGSSGHSSPAPRSPGPRSRGASFERQLEPSPARSPSHARAPSAKVKDKAKVKAMRAKSPPPERAERSERSEESDDFLDSYVRVNLEAIRATDTTQQGAAREMTDPKLERSSEMTRLSSVGNGDALVALLETEVESLKNQLERTKLQMSDVQKTNGDLKMELRQKGREHSEYMNDVEFDQTRFMSQIEDYQYEQADESKQLISSLEARLRDSEESLALAEQEAASLSAKLASAVSSVSALEVALTRAAEEGREDRAQAAELEGRVGELEDAVTARDRDVRARDTELAAGREAVITLEAEVTDGRRRVAELEGQLRVVTEKHVAAAMEAESLRQRLRETEDSLQRTQRDAADKVKVTEAELGRERERLGRQVDQLQRHLDTVEAQTNMADSINHNMADLMKEKDETIAALEEKVLEGEARAEELSEGLTQEAEDNGRLGKQAADLANDNACLQQRVADLQGEMGELEEEYGRVVDEARDLGRALSGRDTERALLTQDVGRVEERVQELEAQNLALTAELEQRQKENEALTAEVEMNQRQAAENTDRLTQDQQAWEERINALKADKDQLAKKIDQLTQDKEELQNGVDELSVDKQDAQARIDQLTADKQQLQDSLMARSDQDSGMKQQYQHLSQELDVARAEVEVLNSRNNRLMDDLESVERLNSESLSELEQVRGLYKVTLTSLGESENRVAELEGDSKNTEELEQLMSELESVKAQLADAEASQEELSQELSRSEAAKEQLQQRLAKQEQHFQSEMEAKYHELEESQKSLDDLQLKLQETDRAMEEESQFLATMAKSAVLERSAASSAQSSPRSDSSRNNDIPKSYDDLKAAHKLLLIEHRALKKQLQEVDVRCHGADMVNLTLKQEVKNLEAGFQDQSQQLQTKVSELTTQVSNLEKRNKKLERRSRTLEIHENVDQESQTEGPLNGQWIQEKSQNDAEIQERVQELQDELDLSDTKVNQLMNRLIQQRSFEVELDLLNQQLENLEAENRKISGKLSDDDEEESAAERSLAGQLRELKLKVQQSVGLMDDCYKAMSDTVIDMDDCSFEEDSSTPSTKSQLQSAVHMLKDAKNLLPHGSENGAVGISDDVKLRLFAERLATEAVILGEMSYLVRADKNSQDDMLKDIYVAKGKVMEIDTFLSKNYCDLDCEDGFLSNSEADKLSTCASLLSDKMRIQSQLLAAMDEVKSLSSGNVDVFVTDDKCMQDVARSCLGLSDLSTNYMSGSSPPIQRLASGLSHSMVRSDLSCIFNRLKVNENLGPLSSSSSLSQDLLVQKETRTLSEQLRMTNDNLQHKVGPVLEERVKDIAQALVRCDKCSAGQAEYLDIFSTELRHTTHRYLSVRGVSISSTSDKDSILYSQPFSKHLLNICDLHLSRTVQDIANSCQAISEKELSVFNKSEQETWEKERTSLLLQIAFIIAQLSLVESLSSYFTSASDSGAGSLHTSSSSSSLPELYSSSEDHKEQLASMLAKGAASRNSLASFLLNNTARGERHAVDAHTWQDQITALASQLVDADVKISKHKLTVPDYQNLVTREAVTQAQLSYLHCHLRLRHQAAMDEVQRTAGVAQRSDDDWELQLEQLEMQLEETQQQLSAAEQRGADIQVDLTAELERRETSHAREVAALKDGYDIRVRSLQADLSAASADLTALQAAAAHATSRLTEERDHELAAAHAKMAALEAELADTRPLEASPDVTADISVCLTAEEADAMREKAEQAERLRLQLEDEKRKHMDELSRLQEAFEGDSTTAAQTILNSKIQQLEEQITNMQHDYEQELSVQQTAHRRELARSKDDMMSLVDAAEAKSSVLDEDGLRRRYVKELDRIKAMYDRSFSAMERSHQKVLLELRRASQRERDALRAEKDDLLAEETRATQAALDAMRKAHEAEITKERNRFLDVIAKTYSAGDVETLQRQHEEDLNLIQTELKSLSEEYSVRCLEKAALEERLESQAKVLGATRRRVQDLMASKEEVVTRNKHDIEKLKRQVLCGAETTGGNAPNPQKLLKIKETEINQLNDEISILREQLAGTNEELEESMNKFHDLHSLHSVSEQRHRRDLEELRRQVRDTSQLEASDEGTDGPELGHSSRWTVINSDIMTSTPFTDHDPASNATKRAELVTSEARLASQSSNEATISASQSAAPRDGSPYRRLPAVTPEMRTAKKALWRQRQPERARSTPGLTGSVTLTLQKQMAGDHITAASTFDPKQRPPMMKRPSLSFEPNRGSEGNIIADHIYCLYWVFS